MNRIIINADDFGMNEQNSRAIDEAFGKGLVTDTTMMANRDYFDGALALARSAGFFDKIGVHLNLTEGVPLTQDIKRLERFVTDGSFNKRYDRAEPLTDAEKDAVYAELTAQVKKLRDAGIAVTHADSHHHIHTGAYIAPIAEQVCRENGILKIRILRNTEKIPPEQRARNDRFNRRLSGQGFVTTRCFAYVTDLEEAEIPDSTEIMVHPDYDKNGILIDRRGRENGCPVGYPLPDFRKRKNVVLSGYSAL